MTWHLADKGWNELTLIGKRWHIYLHTMKPTTASIRKRTAQIAPPIIPALNCSWPRTRLSSHALFGKKIVAFADIFPNLVICGFERLLVAADTWISYFAFPFKFVITN